MLDIHKGKESSEEQKFTNRFSSSLYALLIMRLIFFSPSVGFVIEVLLYCTTFSFFDNKMFITMNSDILFCV